LEVLLLRKEKNGKAIRKEGDLINKKRIMYVDSEFKEYIEGLHKSFLDQHGIDVPRAKITKMATEKLKAFDFEKDAKSILVNGKRRRQIIIEL